MLIGALLIAAVAASLLVDAGHVTEFSMPEEQPIRTLVGSVRENPDVADLTSSPESLRFNFRFSSGPYELFSIDNRSGDIRTRRRIDREQLCASDLPTSSSTSCSLELDVTVLPLRFYRILKVVVTVVDINDNGPSFPQPRMSLEIKERSPPGIRVPVPAAEDPDAGEFGVQRYSLAESSAVFQLRVSDTSGGGHDVWLTLDRPLDREQQRTYSLTVIAYDGGAPPKSGSVDIQVIVGDANDNSPKFDSSSYEAEVSESSPVGTTILRLHADDPDDGLNGVVVYRLAQRPGQRPAPFAVDNRTGEIYLIGGLDFEERRSYQLTVVAGDLGVGSLPAYARVSVRVLDENDNVPDVLVNPLTESGRVEVMENAEVGAFAAYVAVRDADSGKNGAAECRVGTNGDRPEAPFRLEAVSSSEYKLLTTSTLDREATSRYWLTVTCVDQGSPSLTGSTDVEVFVLDENDHDPVFADAGNVKVVRQAEGNRVGAVIGHVAATDQDEGPNARLRYSIRPVDGTPDNVVEVTADSGNVVARVRLDYETRREYRYEVTVRDGGTPSRSATQSLVVQVIDVNDERPRFDKTAYYFSVAENRPVGTTVGTVRATDADVSPAFSRVTYAMPHAGAAAFDIDSASGVITLSRRIDREQTSSFEFTVTAGNDGFPETTTSVAVSINVDDENDNSPVVHFPTTSDRLLVELSRLTAIGTLVTRVDASDPDTGANGELSYVIAHGNEEGLFAVDQRTGAVTVARRLDAVYGRSFRLVVTVKDRGSPERLSVADLTVAVNASTNSPASAAVSRHGGAVDAARITVVAAVVSGSIVVMTIIVVILVVLACRCRRRKSRRRRQDWLRQQYHAEGACSKASGSIPSIRRDVIGVGAECSPVPSVVDGRSLRTWSAVDKATETEQEDTENDDVPLSGLLQCTRRDVDDAQSVALMSSVVSGPSTAAGSQSQRTTPDVLRPAACGPGIDSSTTTPHGAVGGGGGGQLRGPGRHRRHHGHGGGHRRRARSPAYHRPCSASAAQRLTVPQRRTPRHSSKSDFEAGNDSDSEFSGCTTCRDSGMDPSEDSDHVPYLRQLT